MTEIPWGEVFVKLGGITAVGVAVVGALWKAFQALSEKWIDRRFAEKLKKVELQHDVMVRHLQSSIDREYDRATRLHASEFEALSKGWRMLHEAYWVARASTGRGHRVHDFTQMSDAQAAHFIDNSTDLADWQKDELRRIPTAKGRADYYQRAWWWFQYEKCERSRMKLVMFIDRNAIFLRPEIRDLFDRIERRIRDAAIELEMRNRGARGEGTFDRSTALAVAEDELYKPLEALIHARVWSSAAPRDQQAKPEATDVRPDA